ncbi:MAG TPA: hypothetical protein PKC79_17465 [Solidesulfovibrio magneticus]|nr:hypothetical protein [Solidesulfovibrio magneticus]
MASGMRVKWPIISVLLCVAFFVFVFDKPFERLYRSFASRFKETWTPVVRLLPCSNVMQDILWNESNNVEILPADVDGWTFLAAKDAGRPAIVVVSVHKDREQVLFFPRFSGQQGSVSVYEVIGQGVYNLLARADHHGEGWSDIGRQARIDLLVLEHGFEKKEFRAKIRFVLLGAGSQLWVKDSMVLF